MSATAVFSLRLPIARVDTLKRLARRSDRSAADLAARLVDEGLRRSEFAMIDFRDTPSGREAYIQGTRIQIWRVVTLVRDYNGDIAKVAEHLRWPDSKVKAALNYAEAYPQEIEDSIADYRSYDFDKLRRLIPSLEQFPVPSTKVQTK